MIKKTGQMILFVSSFVSMLFSFLLGVSATIRNNFTDFTLAIILCLYSIKILVK